MNRLLAIALMAASVVLLTQPALALTTAATTDLTQLSITITDLDLTDGITSGFGLDKHSTARVYYWPKTPAGISGGGSDDASGINGWSTNLSYSVVLGGVNSHAQIVNGFASSSTQGLILGTTTSAWSGFWADFTLTGHTQVDISVLGTVSLDLMGIGTDEAYVSSWLSMWDITDGHGGQFINARDDVKWDSWWGSSNSLSKTLHITATNTGTETLTGLLEIENNAQTQSNARTVPEPTTLLLLGSGLTGLAGLAWRHTQ